MHFTGGRAAGSLQLTIFINPSTLSLGPNQESTNVGVMVDPTLIVDPIPMVDHMPIVEPMPILQT